MSRTEWLQGFGHEVLILQANRVRAFVRGNKNDAHDARAQAQNYPRPCIEAAPERGIQGTQYEMGSGGISRAGMYPGRLSQQAVPQIHNHGPFLLVVLAAA